MRKQRRKKEFRTSRQEIKINLIFTSIKGQQIGPTEPSGQVRMLRQTEIQKEMKKRGKQSEVRENILCNFSFRVPMEWRSIWISCSKASEKEKERINGKVKADGNETVPQTKVT
jgi:hypothetical protein